MKFTDIIVCDDIRREQGNKRTIVGAYADKILFHPTRNPMEWPTFKQLGFYFKVIKEEGDSDIDNFKGSIFHTPIGKSKEETKKLGNIEGEINVKIFTTIVIDLLLPLQLPGLGTLHLGFQVFNQQEKIDEIFRDLIEIEVQTVPRHQKVDHLR